MNCLMIFGSSLRKLGRNQIITSILMISSCNTMFLSIVLGDFSLAHHKPKIMRSLFCKKERVFYNTWIFIFLPCKPQIGKYLHCFSMKMSFLTGSKLKLNWFLYLQIIQATPKCSKSLFASSHWNKFSK